MAEWLTPGACPVDWGQQDWQDGWDHPSAEQDVEEWAHGARLRYKGDRENDVEAPNCKSSQLEPEISREEKTFGDWLANTFSICGCGEKTKRDEKQDC